LLRVLQEHLQHQALEVHKQPILLYQEADLPQLPQLVVGQVVFMEMLQTQLAVMAAVAVAVVLMVAIVLVATEYIQVVHI
jgi:hypothetical protein